MSTELWVFDTSALIAIKSAVPRDGHEPLFKGLTRLVRARRLVFPKEVLGELRRERQGRRRSDLLWLWALSSEARACRVSPPFAAVKAVLASVPELVDPAADSLVERADPYVLALAQVLRADGNDARVVTEETRDVPWKVSLYTACGVLRIPTVGLADFLTATTFRGTKRV
jgi:Domain of unknown function (DUF4411)